MRGGFYVLVLFFLLILLSGSSLGRPLYLSNGDPFYTVVVIDNAPVLSDPEESASKRNELPFGKLVYVYKISKDKCFFLVGNMNNKKFGWVDRYYLLVKEDKNEKCGFSPISEALTSKKKVYRKIITRNNISEGQAIEKVKFYTGPDERKYKICYESNLLKIWYIYREEEKNGQKYYLVGESDNWSLDCLFGSEKSLAIAGWVKAGLCYQWNTRVALEFYKENFKERERVKFFNTHREAKLYYIDKKKIEFIAEEPNSSEPLSYVDMRYPVIELSEGIYKVGIPGKIFSSKGEEILISERKLRETFQKLYELQSHSRQIDVLFVIDHTTSMRPHFGYVKRAVEDFIKEIPDFFKVRIRFALCTYRDYPEREFLFKRWVDFRNANNLEVFKKALEKAKSNCGDVYDRTPKEAVFYGLVSAINNVSWRKDSSRFVILIGDVGDHPNDPNGYTDAQGFPTDKVIQSLKEKKVFFYAVQVNYLKQREAYQAFNTQMRYLLEKYGYGYVKHANTTSHEDFYNILKNIRREVTLALKFYDCLSNGNSMDVCLKKLANSPIGFTSKFLELAKEKLKERGISEEILNQIKKLVQVCGEGWTRLKDRHGYIQMREVILVSKTDLQILIGILANLCRPGKGGKGKEIEKNFGSFIINAISAVTGDEYQDGERLNKFLEKATGIPVRKRRLLRYTKEGLNNICRKDPNECRKIRSLLKRSYAFLQSVMGEYEVRECNIEGNIRIIPVYTNKQENIKKEKKWWFSTKGGAEYAWVPWEYFP